MELVAREWSLEPGAGAWSWSLENGRWRMVASAWRTWSMVASAWSLENGAGAWSMVAGAWSWRMEPRAGWMRSLDGCARSWMCNGNHSFFYSNNAIPVTSRYIAVRHGIHMNSPVPRLGLDSVQGRAGPEQLEDKNKPARSVQRSRKTLVGSISTSTRAGVEPEPLATRTGHHQVGSTW